MKVLYAASTARHLRDFHLPVLDGLRAEGCDVTVVCRDAHSLKGPWKTLDIPLTKSFFSVKNIRSFHLLYRSIKRERYDIVSTHTALAGFVARMALCFAGKKGAFCLHTAHGYLFGRNAGLFGKLTYVFEKACAGVTDLILTMNREDTDYAQKLVKKGGRVEKIPGMGVDLTRFSPADKEEKARIRHELDLPDGFMIFCAAEFSPRKNHETLIRAMPRVVSGIPGAYLLLAGDGKLKDRLGRLARGLHVEDAVRFIGYVDDTAPYVKACDMAMSASLTEGLPLSVMEALSCGVPVAASRVKGHTDLLEDGAGLLFGPRNPEEAAQCCVSVAQSPEKFVQVNQMCPKLCHKPLAISVFLGFHKKRG